MKIISLRLFAVSFISTEKCTYIYRMKAVDALSKLGKEISAVYKIQAKLQGFLGSGILVVNCSVVYPGKEFHIRSPLLFFSSNQLAPKFNYISDKSVLAVTEYKQFQ